MTSDPTRPSMSHDEVKEALLDLDLDGRTLDAGEPTDALLAAVSDPRVREHLTGCEECRGVLASLSALDGMLVAREGTDDRSEHGTEEGEDGADLVSVERWLAAPTPSDALIERTLARVHALASEPEPPAVERAEARRDAGERGVLALLVSLVGGLLGGLWALVKLAASPFARRVERASSAGAAHGVARDAAHDAGAERAAPRRSRGWMIAIPAAAALAAAFLAVPFLESGAEEENLALDQQTAEDRLIVVTSPTGATVTLDGESRNAPSFLPDDSRRDNLLENASNRVSDGIAGHRGGDGAGGDVGGADFWGWHSDQGPTEESGELDESESSEVLARNQEGEGRVAPTPEAVAEITIGGQLATPRVDVGDDHDGDEFDRRSELRAADDGRSFRTATGTFARGELERSRHEHAPEEPASGYRALPESGRGQPPTGGSPRGPVALDALGDLEDVPAHLAQQDTPTPPADPAPVERPRGGRDRGVVAEGQTAPSNGRFSAELAQRQLGPSSDVSILDGDFEQNVDLAPSARWLASRDRLEGVSFQPASGYWANTYLPGDPALRLLRRRLADDPDALALARLAEPDAAYLDPPRRGALALGLAADRAAVEGPSRVLLSVALRGAAQRVGRRPTLHAQVVLDLRRPLDEAEQGRVRALLAALSEARDGADRVGVIAAGPRGGEVLPLGHLRFGEVSVALARIFGSANEAPATSLSLDEATERAVTSVGQLDDASATLGSALVIVVTPGLDAAQGARLERVAHVGALAGVTTSVLGLSDAAASAPAVERVALAGQGRRYALSDAHGADDTVSDELEAVSRVVARAVRLRIRLAEGVRLIDVLGSRRLDAPQAQRVREAERAVDRALAQRLGIVSDRGEDEDGIQIVVPAFLAGDTHVVLLDLAVPGPGPVADVQARFKDLSTLGNGTLTDRLELARGTAAHATPRSGRASAARGPAERAVLRAFLGYRISVALREAAAHLDAGQPQLALTAVRSAGAQVRDVRRSEPALRSDEGLARDLELCERIATRLDAGASPSMADALRYAAHRRTMGDPLALGGDIHPVLVE